MADAKRSKRAQRAGAGSAPARERTDWYRIAAIAAGVVGTALVVGAVARSRTARRVGVLGLAHLAERNAGRIAHATQAFASRWWPKVSSGVVEVVRKPAALLGH
jgi:predicted anti-sigma-YlaC factor YlaD